MPGPKMGPRPPDFDEELVKKAPTFQKWLKLTPGQSLTYACREFIKGGVEDEERLMRRIMIARRNNIKDHAELKRARAVEAERRGVIPEGRGKKKGNDSKPEYILRDGEVEQDGPMNSLVPPLRPPSPSNPSGTKRRRVAGQMQPTDDAILMEMDVQAVEATRSYRKWLSLPPGTLFRYNQRYIKGHADHDWLLKKNIWRRMRYRRENQFKLKKLKSEEVRGDWTSWKPDMIDPPLAVDADIGLEGEEDEVTRAVHDAAVEAASQVHAFEPGIDAEAVAALGADDPIVSSALDAAAQLAAAAVEDVADVAGLHGNGVAGHLEDNALTVQLHANDVAAHLGGSGVADPMAAAGVNGIGNDVDDDGGDFLDIETLDDGFGAPIPKK